MKPFRPTKVAVVLAMSLMTVVDASRRVEATPVLSPVEEFAFAQSTEADVGAYLLELSLGADLGAGGSGVLAYDGSYGGSADPDVLATGSYQGSLSGVFAGLGVVATLGATRIGNPNEVGDPIYTVTSNWNVYLDLAKPPLRTYTDSGTITVNANGTADIAITLTENKLKTTSDLMGTGLPATTDVVDGMTVVTIQGPTMTTKPLKVKSSATFLMNATSMKFSSDISGSGLAQGYTILNNGEITKVQAAGVINGNDNFTVSMASPIPEPSSLSVLGGMLAAFMTPLWISRARRRASHGGT
jgi:hypothetical protein